jgi:hypothetical protein
VKTLRSTFREPAANVAWQKQLRDQYLDEGMPPVPHLDIKQAIVRPVGRRLAEQIILKYEWLGTMASSAYHYGIFFGDYCAGVVCIGTGALLAGAYLSDQFGLIPENILVLARGANVHWSPTGTNSRLVSIACRLVRRDTAKSLIIAFSDSDAGEIGTIYQACNWVYIGRGRSSRPDGEFIAPNGRVFNKRIVGQVAKANGVKYSTAKNAMLLNGWDMQPENVKRRYVCILDKKDKALTRRVEAMRQPYPKRAGG